jgi:hypothetical protein
MADLELTGSLQPCTHLNLADADVEAALLDAQRNNLMTALQGEDEDGSEDGMSEDEEEDE